MSYYVAERPEHGAFVEVTVGVSRPRPARTADLERTATLAARYPGGRVVRVDPGNRRTVLGKDAVGRWVDARAR